VRAAGSTVLGGVTAVAPAIAAAVEPIIGGALPIRLIAWDGSVAGDESAPVVRLRGPDAIRRIFWRPGELGAAQAYVCGDIDVDDDLGTALGAVLSRIGERRLKWSKPSPVALGRLCLTVARLGAFGLPPRAPATQARMRGRLHSLSRDRAAISHHYDASNDLYRLILDPSMAYSCAYWDPSRSNLTLAQAQSDKLDRICNQIGLHEQPGARLLDVGCGWGSLSLHAAVHYGAQVVGLTLSREQKVYIDDAVRERGLQDRVEIRVQDYRALTDGPYDAVASIEMGEHVGEANYPVYASTLQKSVRPGGRVLVQQMSRRGDHRGGGPFIESFIAPDMHMRPIGETVALLEDSGLKVVSVQAMREHYVRTADAWIENLEKHWHTATELVGEEAARVWRLYLAGGRLAFEQGRMGVDQVLLVR
jgi:cyclopropane-fatty-acyl-phospholipid synthase